MNNLNDLLEIEITNILESLPDKLRADANMGKSHSQLILLPQQKNLISNLPEELHKLPAMRRFADYCRKAGLKMRVASSYYDSYDGVALVNLNW